jgi:hypothetical protein
MDARPHLLFMKSGSVAISGKLSRTGAQQECAQAMEAPDTAVMLDTLGNTKQIRSERIKSETRS